MPAAKVPKPVGDPFVLKMDAFADSLLEKAKADDIGFRDKLDAFKELAAWVRIKKGSGDGGDGRGGSLAELKSKLAETNGAAHSGKGSARSQRISRGQQVRFHGRPNNGGPALDAIRRKLPGADAGNNAGGGDGAVRSSIGAAGSLGGIQPGDDGDE